MYIHLFSYSEHVFATYCQYYSTLYAFVFDRFSTEKWLQKRWKTDIEKVTSIHNFDESMGIFSLFVRSALSVDITTPNNQTLKDVSLRRTVLYKQRLDLAQKLCKKHNLFKKSNKVMTDNLLWNIPHQVSLYIIIFIQFLCYFSYFYNFSLFIVLIWKLVYHPGLTFKF